MGTGSQMLEQAKSAIAGSGTKGKLAGGAVLAAIAALLANSGKGRRLSALQKLMLVLSAGGAGYWGTGKLQGKLQGMLDAAQGAGATPAGGGVKKQGAETSGIPQTGITLANAGGAPANRPANSQVKPAGEEASKGAPSERYFQMGRDSGVPVLQQLDPVNRLNSAAAVQYMLQHAGYKGAVETAGDDTASEEDSPKTHIPADADGEAVKKVLNAKKPSDEFQDMNEAGFDISGRR